MSDLSLPPLTWVAPAVADIRQPAPRFVWPVPALGGYAAAAAPVQPERCEIEGVNGRVMEGLLVEFDPERLRAKLLTPTTRSPVSLRFDQFRRLTLLPPLCPATEDLAETVPAPQPALDPVPYQLVDAQQQVREGLTVAPHEEPWGVFLFEPLGADGALRRSFVPRAAFESASFGEPIGALLVAQQATTPEVVADALQEQAALRARRIGEALVVRQVVTPEQLDAALDQQSRMPMVRIGEALLALGYVTQDQLDAALEAQKSDRNIPLGELLVRRGDITRADLQQALARKMGYPLVDVRQFPPEAAALAQVPHALAHRLQALPLVQRAGRLVVAVVDPARRQTLDEIEFVAQRSIVPVLARAEELPAAIDLAYERIGMGSGVGAWLPADGLDFDKPSSSGERESADTGELLATLERQGADGRDDADERQIEQSDNSLVKLINQMILEAQAQGVSDIHVECQPGREKLRIRFRRDGVLRPYLELPHTYRSALIARLKIMCDLDISERRKPQDGKINFGKFHPGARLELRLATIPTHGGLEDAVLRLLANARPMPLDKLGLSEANLQGLKAGIERPYGMLLCVGPTGSGKTTTLHALLGHINKPDRKIWTAEDPIEITQPGLRQVQVNAKIEWTFAKALRAFLRADPDVVMVGEIRDQETAQTAIEASLTGHLVLSTLHTNSAVETVTRLLDMGMDPFNFADSLLAVLAQRLVRRLCTSCTTQRDATPAEVDEWLDDHRHAYADADAGPQREALRAEWVQRFGVDGRLQHHHAPGCKACDGSGFRGRVAIHELLLVSKELRRLIQTGSRAEQLLVVAQRDGMRTLRQDGIEKVLAGLTTIEEVRATSNL